MRSIVIAALLFTYTSAAFAQNENKPPVEGRVKIIHLSADTSKHLEPPPVPVTSIRVIPLCSDTSRLGFVKMGVLDKLAIGIADKPLQQYLQDFVNAQYKGVFRDTGIQLLWIVNELRISEAQMLSRAYVQLKATVYVSAGQSQYRLLTQFDHTIFKKGLSAENKHDENIADILQLLFRESVTLAAAMPPDSLAPQTLDGVLASEQQRFNVPVLTSPGYAHGVYTTYKQFLDNAPAIDSFKVNVNLFGVVQVNAIGADGRRTPIEHPWGVCMNGKIYKCEGNKLVPLERYGQGFAISGYLNDSNQKNGAMWIEGLGSALSGEIPIFSKSGMPLVYSNPYITKGYPEATRLDMETAELTF